MPTRAFWSWLLCDGNGEKIAELATATGRTLAFKRNTYAEAACVIDHEDEAAEKLLDALRYGIPQLKCYRWVPPYATGTLCFRGYLAPFTEQAEESATLNLVFRSPFWRLIGGGQEQGRFTDADVTFTGQDAGQIAKQLIDTANSDSPTGLATTGTIDATKTRDRTYQFANVGEAIVNLTNVLDGFDFEELFTEGTDLATFRVYAEMGIDRPAARFEYGAETLNNVRSVSRTTQPPINRARVLGASGMDGTKEHAASIATYGLWMVQTAASDVTEQATLDDKAQAMLRPDPVKTVGFVPEFGLPGCPQPWDDFWIGDTVRFYARRDSITEDVAVRVNELRVVIDDDGTEAVEIPDPAMPHEDAVIRSRIVVETTASGADYRTPPDLGGLIGTLSSRISALERRH